jgi:hypothetical protein
MKLLSRNVTAPLPAVTVWPVTSISRAPLQNFLGRTMCRKVTEPSLSVRAPIAVIRLMICTSVRSSSPPVSSPSCRFSCASAPRPIGYSAEVATSLLRGPDRPVTVVGEWTQSILRWLGPVLFGLVLLSLRGRVKR